MAGQWRRQTRKQASMSPGSDGPVVIANVFDAVKLVGADPATPDANTLYKGLIPKAWIRFDMSNELVADSFNVSSITDGSVGGDTVNWDRAFANSSYSLGASHRHRVSVTRSVALSIDQFLPGSAAVRMHDLANNVGYDDVALSLQAFGAQ